jgi:hypothetical protein
VEGGIAGAAFFTYSVRREKFPKTDIPDPCAAWVAPGLKNPSDSKRNCLDHLYPHLYPRAAIGTIDQ